MNRFAPTVGLQGPQHYWAEMIALSPAGFTIGDIHGRTNGSAKSVVKKYVLACLKQGVIARCGTRPGIAGRSFALYRVIDPRQPAPIERRPDFANDRGRRAQQLWTAMRGLRVFGAAEIALAASTDDVAISVRRAREFILALSKAGYVAEISDRTRVGQNAHWRLLPHMNTGPLAPALTRTGVIDRNRPALVNPNGSSASHPSLRRAS